MFMVGDNFVCDFRTDLDELRADTELLNKLIYFKKNERFYLDLGGNRQD